jgi:hypothetical protein
LNNNEIVKVNQDQWPVIDALFSDALLTLNKPNDITFCVKCLSFHKHNDENEEEKEDHCIFYLATD